MFVTNWCLQSYKQMKHHPQPVVPLPSTAQSEPAAAGGGGLLNQNQSLNYYYWFFFFLSLLRGWFAFKRPNN